VAVRNFNGGALIIMEKPCWGDVPVVSVTVTKKGNVPAVVGVPEMTPVVGLKVSPGGKAPLVIAQVQGQLSGAAVNVVEYGVPTCPLGSVLGKIVGAARIGLVSIKARPVRRNRQISPRYNA